MRYVPAWLGLGLLLAAGPAWAQGPDVAIEALKIGAGAATAGQPVSLAAVVRRLDKHRSTKDPLGSAVDVEVGFFVSGETKPFDVKRATLGPGDAETLEARWPARAGKFILVARILRLTVQQKAIVDANPANNQKASEPLVVAAAPPAARPPGPAMVTTAPLRVTGTPDLPAPAASFQPITVATAPLRVSGAAELPAPSGAFRPVTINTVPLRVTGAP